MVRLTIFPGNIATPIFGCPRPGILFDIVEQGVDWKIDLKAATDQQREEWSDANLEARIFRAFKIGRRIHFVGQEVDGLGRHDDARELYEQTQELKRHIVAIAAGLQASQGRSLVIASDDDERGLRIEVERPVH